MASALFGTRFRAAVGDPGGASPVFEDSEIDDYGDQADEVYPNASFNAKVLFAATLGIRALLAKYATQVSYTQNASSESLGQISTNYLALLKTYEDQLSKLLDATEAGVMWGSTSVTPTRDEEFPDA